MKNKYFKHLISLLLLLFTSSLIFSNPAVLLDVDFTRDSAEWKTKFPTPIWNAGNTVYQTSVTELQIDDFKFNGAYGKFNAGSGTMGQPLYIENMTNFRRWAFRIGTDGSSYLELPELSSIGRFTVFCKNANTSNEVAMNIQRFVDNNWQTIKTVYLPPHHNQNFELQKEEFLNINEPVKLRLTGSDKNIHVYEIRAHAYHPDYPKEKPLRLILVPDAQTYANQSHLTHIYGNIAAWINSMADEVKFVLQQGDITQLNDAAQWSIAAGALNLLEGRNIPMTYCAGNHDMGRHGDSRNTTNMNAYLPHSRYSRHDYFGGTFEPGKVDNTWHTFSKGDYKFLILSLEYLPRNKVIDWAKTVIASHPKHNVIINTHSYLGSGDNLNTGIPQDGLKATGDEAPNDGKNLWEKLVRQYANVRFVFSGHVLGDGAGKLVSTGLNGNKVYQFIANYQGGVDGTQDERNGMNRILDIEPEHRRFTIRTYSDYQKRFNTRTDQVYYYTDVDFIKDGPAQQPIVEPTDILSEEISSKRWEDELKLLNPGYNTPAIGGSNAFTNLNSTDLYFNKYKLSGAIESLAVLPCASTENIQHDHNGVAVAFRFTNNASGIFELPEVPKAGLLTLHVKNGNGENTTMLALEKYEEGTWKFITSLELLPSNALRTSRDEIITYPVNINQPVKLRLRNMGTRYINLYRISLGGDPAPENPKESFMFSEDFTGFTSSSLVKNDDVLIITPQILQSTLPGWEANNTLIQIAGDNKRLIIGSESADTAYIKLPVMDLSQPFHISFGFRNRKGDNPVDIMNMYLDDNLLIWQGFNEQYTFSGYQTDAFVGTANSRITMTVPKMANSAMMVDDIVIYRSLKPAITVPFKGELDFGKVARTTTKTIDIPLKGYNLHSDIKLSLKSGQHFAVTTGNTVSQSTAIAGTTVTVQFTAPESFGLLTDTLIINGFGITPRIMNLKAVDEDYNDLQADINNGNISIHNKNITLSGFSNHQLMVFNTTGTKVAAINGTSDTETVHLKERGAYILQLKNGKQNMTRKVIVQ